MKVISSKILSIILVLMMAFLFFINLNGAANGVILRSSLENSNSYQKEIIIPNYSFDNDESSTNDVKHIDSVVEEIIIEPLVSGLIFPNTPVDFIVETSGPTPEIVKLFLDTNEPSLNMTYDLSKAVIVLSDDLEGLVSVDPERSSTIFNSRIVYWLGPIPLS